MSRAAREAAAPRRPRHRGWLALAAALCLPSSAAWSWWDCAWAYRVPVTLTSGTTGARVVAFSIPAASLPNLDWSRDGADVRLVDSDDQTLLAQFFATSQDATALNVTAQVTLATGGKTIYIYYGNAAANSIAQTASTNPIRYWTRYSTADPNNLSEYFTAWNNAPNATTGYGCTVINGISSLTNNGTFIFGSSTDILWRIETEIYVAVAGIYKFDLSPDFGRGGGLYVDGQVQSKVENWTSDIWGNYFTRTYLSTSVFLQPGWYKILIAGAENGNDGPMDMRVSVSGAAPQVFNATNFTLRAPSCPAVNPTATVVAETGKPTIKVTKTAQVFSDPLDGTVNPKAIPGSRVRFTVSVQQTAASSRPMDMGSLALTDIIPNNMKLFVGDLGAPGSGPVALVSQDNSAPGLIYTYAGLASTTDGVAFSNGAAPPYAYTYTPAPDSASADALVTSMQIKPAGRLCKNTTATGNPPSVQFQFDGVVK